MRDLASDLTALELLRVQRSRLADRMRPPWWFLPGVAILWSLVFAIPFSQRYLSHGFSIWPFFAAALAVACLLQWRLTRVTGVKAGTRPVRALRDGLFYYRPGRPAAVAILVVSLAAIASEHFLLDRGLLAAAIAVAALAVVAEVAAQQAVQRAVRQELRAGGGAA